MVGKRHDMTHEEWHLLQQALPSGRRIPSACKTGEC